jgi:hypothetical protein
MLEAPNYRLLRNGYWRLAADPEQWTSDLQTRVLEIVGRQPPSKHPQTLELRYPDSDRGDLFYLKVFHQMPGIATLKDLFRTSKAFRCWRQSVALSKLGFNVSMIIAAGELRRFRLLRRGFVLSRAIDGQTLPVFLKHRRQVSKSGLSFVEKSFELKRLAEEVRRFHSLGFVHGDLVATNILVAEGERNGKRFFFMDNDRTRRYPAWFPDFLQKRNLIQLNRMPLAGITLQDRVRFFCCYRNDGDLSSEDRSLLRRIEAKTRQRRQECDAVEITGDFRKLMCWKDGTALGL